MRGRQQRDVQEEEDARAPRRPANEGQIEILKLSGILSENINMVNGCVNSRTTQPVTSFTWTTEYDLGTIVSEEMIPQGIAPKNV